MNCAGQHVDTAGLARRKRHSPVRYRTWWVLIEIGLALTCGSGVIDTRSPDGGIEPAEIRAMEQLPTSANHALPELP
jgi:hypothetical protein